ncbi:MAG: BCD family MFS transporter [Pseudomonadota bacterium]
MTSPSLPATPLSWLSLFRLGLVQTALGAIVVLTTSTLNRVMVVDLALPAALPGLLVGLHYAVQLSRPRWGHGADTGGRRTPWIIGGVALLAAGALGAAGATVLMAGALVAGIALAFVAFVAIGLGVGMAGTNLLALIATRTAPARRPAAATLAWLMMIAGIAVTAGVAGQLLDPYSPERLMAVAAGICAVALTLTIAGVTGIERRAHRPMTPPIPAPTPMTEGAAAPSFAEALREVWADGQARRFTIFVLVSMLAYAAQDLILEPFAGHVFGYTVGESTTLSGTQHGGVFAGMLLTGIVASVWGRGRPGFLRVWCVGGCILSALSLVLLAVGAQSPETWPLDLNVFALGASNGAFAVAAISSMMALASADAQGGQSGGREGIRMGLWGAAQAIGFGAGGLLGALGVDAARALIPDTATAYGTVFTAEAALFLVASLLAARAGRRLAAPPVPANASLMPGE